MVVTQPDGSVTDAPSEPESEGSSGNPFPFADAGADATDAGAGSVDATGGLDASGLIDATDATETEDESEADTVVPCGPAAAGTLFVDPNAGHDDDGGTGSQACPLKSLTHALSLVGDSGAPLTVEIVNTGVAAPTLSQGTGEVFPITVPGGVTIIAEDTTKNTPLVLVGETPMGLLCSGVVGLYLGQANARLSHLVVSAQTPCPGTVGIDIESTSATVDHVTVSDFTGEGIAVGQGSDPSADGAVTIGPGLVVRGCGLYGLYALAPVTVLGGQGGDHTSFTGGGSGVLVESQGMVNIPGATISPSNPDVSDVDVDNNQEMGMWLATDLAQTPSIVTGLHVAGNARLGILSDGPLVLRGSYIGQNEAAVGINGHGIDLGNPVGPDYGRNIFVGNPGGDICGASAQNPVLAAGNIFGTIDCAVGGKLDPSVTCGDTTNVNVSDCTF
jgi:hypothetical protein